MGPDLGFDADAREPEPAIGFIAGPDHVHHPFVVVKFDQAGRSESDETASEVGELIAAHGGVPFTDVIMMSHGWNNGWQDVQNRYRGWADELLKSRAAHPNATDGDFRPLFLGVFWPSLAVPDDAEQGPQIAGADVGADVREFLAGTMSAGDGDRFRKMARADSLDDHDAGEMAQLLGPFMSGHDSDLEGATGALLGADVLQKWRQAGSAFDELEAPAVLNPNPLQLDDDDAPLFGGDVAASAPDRSTTPGGPAAPQLASFLGLRPVWILRIFSMLVMKDRAGRVGAAGVADLLAAVLNAAPADTRVHLVGHSFGGKVMLSALCTAPGATVDSVLLLEPAMSARCFSADVDGNGTPGGYRPALQRCRLGIMSTASSHDFPLRKLFHLAARRKSDLGEVLIAAGDPPSKYVALGGYGPQRFEHVVPTLPHQPDDPYPVGTAGQVVAVVGDDIISGHGHVVNPATAWMLLSQLRAR